MGKFFPTLNRLPNWAKEVLSRGSLYISIGLAIAVVGTSSIYLTRAALMPYHPSQIKD